ncbi:MAG: hypothetical protein ACOCZ6_03975 [Nanoarchaeota archaeon]
MQGDSKVEKNYKLTQYNSVKELVLRNSVRDVPNMYKRKNNDWNGQLFNYF